MRVRIFYKKALFIVYTCYQFRILRNLRVDIIDRLEEHSQSIVIDIHVVLKIRYWTQKWTQGDSIHSIILDIHVLKADYQKFFFPFCATQARYIPYLLALYPWWAPLSRTP